MNKFQRMSGGEPRGHGLAEAVHLAPDTLSPPPVTRWPCQCHPNDHTDHYTFVWCHN